MKHLDKKKQGKRNRINGANFELRVRKDLESKGWIVSKWQNNIEFEEFPGDDGIPFSGEGKLIPAKRKFNPFSKALSLGTGFPDFIAYRLVMIADSGIPSYEVIGVEAKSNGYLDKKEKDKCKWLLDNKVFNSIIIASKNKKEVMYKEYEN